MAKEKIYLIPYSDEEFEMKIINCLRKVFEEQEQEPVVSPLPEILNIDQAAQLLNRSKAWIYSMTSKKNAKDGCTFPFSKPDGKGPLYFRRSELMEWLDQGGTKHALQEQEDFEKEAEEYLKKS